MSNRTRYNALVPAFVSVFMALPLVSEADGGGEFLLPVDVYQEELRSDPARCNALDEATQQIAQTDGMTAADSEAPAGDCQVDVAESEISMEVFTEFGGF